MSSCQYYVKYSFRPHLCRWISIQLEKNWKEEAFTLQCSREQQEADEEWRQQDSEIIEVTVRYLRQSIQDYWDTEKMLTEANRQAQLLEINTLCHWLPETTVSCKQNEGQGDTTICTQFL
ncbi:hypothetical protein BDR07DRAFT_1479360 [Suillus spraguei]|nr:hypothetical protein BDR07DRAFT_1479360 [Suillus spraguei]